MFLFISTTEGLSDNTTWSRNLKQVRRIALKYLHQLPETFEKNDYDYLYAMGHTSSAVSGPAAAYARSILGLMIGNPEYRADDEPAFDYSTDVKSLYFVGPNPVNSTLYIIPISADNEASFQMFDVNGILIMNTEISSSISFNISDFNTGIYFYQITDSKGNKIDSGKLIVNH